MLDFQPSHKIIRNLNLSISRRICLRHVENYLSSSYGISFPSGSFTSMCPLRRLINDDRLHEPTKRQEARLKELARETRARARGWAPRDDRELRHKILRDRSSPPARRHYFSWPLHLNAILSAWEKYVIYGSRVSPTTIGIYCVGCLGVTLAGVPLPRTHFSDPLSSRPPSYFQPLPSKARVQLRRDRDHVRTNRVSRSRGLSLWEIITCAGNFLPQIIRVLPRAVIGGLRASFSISLSPVRLY